MAELVVRCLRSIEAYTKNQSYEVIVVDNASGGDDVERLGALPAVTLIANARNVGFGSANNQAAGVAKGKYLFFINPDAQLLNDAVTVFEEFMERPENSVVACCGADLMDGQGNKQMAYGNFPSLMGVISELGFHRFNPGYFERRYSISRRNRGDDVKYVDYVLGAAMFIRADVFRGAGGFDEGFFLYFEETELAYRFRESGYRCALVPQAKIMHLEGDFDSGHGPNYAKIKWFSESRQRFFRKHKGNLQAFMVKLLLSIQALLRGVFHRDRHYFNVFRIMMKA